MEPGKEGKEKVSHSRHSVAKKAKKEKQKGRIEPEEVIIPLIEEGQGEKARELKDSSLPQHKVFNQTGVAGHIYHALHEGELTARERHKEEEAESLSQSKGKTITKEVIRLPNEESSSVKDTKERLVKDPND
jgi:hypothetical protein